MATPKIAPASLRLDDRKVTLSLEEAKTDFLHVVAKLKPLHVSKFFQWLELQINAYKLNGFVLHGLPSSSLLGSNDDSSSTSSPLLLPIASSSSSLSSSTSSPILSSSTDFFVSSVENGPVSSFPTSAVRPASVPAIGVNSLVAEIMERQQHKSASAHSQRLHKGNPTSAISSTPQGILELLDTRKRRQLEERSRRSPNVDRCSPLLSNLPTPCSTVSSSPASTLSVADVRTSSPTTARLATATPEDSTHAVETQNRQGRTDSGAAPHADVTRDCHQISDDRPPPTSPRLAAVDRPPPASSSSILTPSAVHCASSSSAVTPPPQPTPPCQLQSQLPLQQRPPLTNSLVAATSQSCDSKMVSSANGSLEAVYGNIGNTQQQIQQLLRHQQQMLGSQSILHTHMQYYQMHQFNHLYEPASIGPNGLLPPPFHSLLPTSAVPIVSASLVRHLGGGAPSSSLLAAPSSIIAASMSLPNGPSSAPPSTSPALNSPITASSDATLISTTSINNNVVITRGKIPSVKREKQLLCDDLPAQASTSCDSEKTTPKSFESKTLSESPSSVIVKVEGAEAEVEDGLPNTTTKRYLKHKSKHKKDDRKRRREKRHKERNRSKSSSSLSSSTSDGGGSDVGVSPIKRKFKMSPRERESATVSAAAASPSAAVEKHLPLRHSSKEEDNDKHDDVASDDVERKTEGGISLLAKDEPMVAEREDSKCPTQAQTIENGATVRQNDNRTVEDEDDDDDDDDEEGGLVITEDAPLVDNCNSDEDDEEVDVDSVDDVDPRDRSLILKLNAAMEAGDAVALSRTLTTVDDRKCIVEYSLAHGEDAAEDKFGVHRKMIARWKREVDVMNAVNPMLRTRYYKELTRRRKRLNGDDDGDDVDNDDPVDDLFDPSQRENSRDGSSTATTTATTRLRNDVVDTMTIPPSCGVGGVRFGASQAGQACEKTVGSLCSPSSSTLVAASQRGLNEDAFDDSVGGAGAEGAGVFLPGDAFGALELDGVMESGGGTKMYTPAQKKAIVEYAVQYGERAAAKKFGVHRKNIYRWKRNHNLMAKTSIKRPSGPRLSIGGEMPEVGVDSVASDGPTAPLIAVSAVGGPANGVATTPTLAVGGGWVFPSPISASPQTSNHSLIAPPPALPPLLPPSNLHPEKNTLTIEVIKTNSSSPSPSLPGQYLNFYNGQCNPMLATATNTPPPATSPFPPLPPPPPPASPLHMHHLPVQQRRGSRPQQPSGSKSSICNGIISKSTNLNNNNNNNNNNPEPWDTLKDVKPDVTNLSVEASGDPCPRLPDGGRALRPDAANQNQGDGNADLGAVRKAVEATHGTSTSSSQSREPTSSTEIVELRPKKRKRKNSGRAV